MSLTQHLAFRGGLVPQAPHSLSVAFVLELMRKPTCLWDQELKQCGPGGYLPSHLGTALLRSRGTAVWCIGIRLPSCSLGFCNLVLLKVVRPAGVTSLGMFIEMHILWPPLDLLNQKLQDGAQQSSF